MGCVGAWARGWGEFRDEAGAGVGAVGRVGAETGADGAACEGVGGWVWTVGCCS
jgi:hypothetical protein